MVTYMNVAGTNPVLSTSLEGERYHCCIRAEVWLFETLLIISHPGDKRQLIDLLPLVCVESGTWDHDKVNSSVNCSFTESSLVNESLNFQSWSNVHNTRALVQHTSVFEWATKGSVLLRFEATPWTSTLARNAEAMRVRYTHSALTQFHVLLPANYYELLPLEQCQLKYYQEAVKTQDNMTTRFEEESSPYVPT